MKLVTEFAAQRIHCMAAAPTPATPTSRRCSALIHVFVATVLSQLQPWLLIHIFMATILSQYSPAASQKCNPCRCCHLYSLQSCCLFPGPLWNVMLTVLHATCRSEAVRSEAVEWAIDSTEVQAALR